MIDLRSYSLLIFTNKLFMIIRNFSFLGQFICGEKRCDEKENLRSWEVLFGYTEHGKKRDALVKLSKLIILFRFYLSKF